MLKIKYSDIKFQNILVIKKGSVLFEPGISYIKGENGCGKTSFFNLLFGSLENYSCEIIIDGHQIDSKNLFKLRNNYFAYSSQQNFLFDKLTIKENINIIVNKKLDEQKLVEISRILLFEDVLIRNAKVKKLSGGEKQKLKLLMTLLSDTPIVILDEPFNNLDSDTIDNLNKYLITINRYLLITSHIEIEGANVYQIVNTEIQSNVYFKNRELEYKNEEIVINKELLDNKKILVKTNTRFRQSLYFINAIMISLCLIAVFHTISVYNQASSDKSNFVFSDTSTLINPPLYNSYFPTFGNVQWLDDIPTYFNDEHISKLEQLDYVTKVIATKNRNYAVGGILYDGEYEIDIEQIDKKYKLDEDDEYTFTSSLYPNAIASNIPLQYFTINTGTINKFIAGSFPIDNSNEVIIDTIVADYFISELSLASYEQLIGETIDVPVKNINTNEQSTIPLIVSGVFETNILSESEHTKATIVISFDENNRYVHEVYAQYQQPEILLDKTQSRVESIGVDRSFINSQMLPETAYDTLYIEVENEEDLQYLVEDITKYNKYIEIENNYVNGKTLNFQYLSKIILMNIVIIIMLLIVYIIVVIAMMKLLKQSFMGILQKLNFYGYSNEEQTKYLNFEIKEYLLNILVINLAISLFIQFSILVNATIIYIFVINLFVFLLNMLIIKLVIRRSINI